MENSVKEELNLCVEIKKQQEIINCALSITEKVLQVLRGAMPQDETECMKDDCIFDTLKINSRNLSSLERNINEIARKVIG